MASSLAAQLAQGASLNTALLVDRSKRRPTESYLFTGREADRHDLESIHALAVNGLIQLKSLDHRFENYENDLFSDPAKVLDRTLQSAEANVVLDSSISSFLGLLGPFLLEAPSGKVIEWLVKRLRVNEFNVEAILALFLPFHETPHFTKMLTILHIKDQSVWHFLLAFKTAVKPVPRSALVAEMMRNSDLARFISSLLLNALRQDHAHRALVAFHTSTLLDFVARSKTLDEGALAYLLPAILDSLKTSSNAKGALAKDVVLGNYVLLSALSQKSVLSQDALKVIVERITSHSALVTAKQYVHVMISVCGPQESIAKLPGKSVETILILPGIENAILDVLCIVGAEKFVWLLIPDLVISKEPVATTILELLISTSKTFDVLVHEITTQLFRQAISLPAAELNSRSRRLLSTIQQRHPSIFQSVCDEAGQGQKDAVEQLLISLTMGVHPDEGTPQNMAAVESMHQDSSVRVLGVRNLYAALSTTTDSTKLDSMKSTLLARVHDTDLSVLEALYSSADSLLSVLSDPAHARAYIDNLVIVLCSSHASPSRQLIRTHLNFLLTQFLPSNEQHTKEVFEKIVFAFLLFSKPRQRTASAVWEIIERAGVEKGIGKCELLGGCVDVVRWEEGKEGVQNESRSVQVMGRINLAVASKMAGTILASNNYPSHLDFLLTKLQDSNAHARHLAYLVSRALLGALSGEHQVSAAHRILEAMKITTLDNMGDFMSSAIGLHAISNDESLGLALVLKPSSWNTTHRLQMAILALLPIIVRPTGVVLDWLSGRGIGSVVGDVRGPRYVQLMQAVYSLANSTSSLPVVSANLLQALFINLGNESLLLLASIWIKSAGDSGQNDDTWAEVRHAALRHAAAFLAAYQATESTVDFQAIVPSFLAALQDADSRIRRAAVECISLLADMSKAKVTSLYAADTIYGENSGNLKYVEWENQGRYLRMLAAHRDHLEADPGHVRLLHQAELTRSKSETKKDSRYKESMLCYLLSHVTTCHVPTVQLSLLTILEIVQDPLKAHFLLPLLSMISDESSMTDLASQLGASFGAFATLVHSAFNATAAKELNDESNQSWPTFLKSVRQTLEVETMQPSFAIIRQSLMNGLFASLKLDRQVALCLSLIDWSSHNPQTYQQCKALLVGLVGNASLAIYLLRIYQPENSDTADRASKRPRYEDLSESASRDTLRSMTILAEVINAASIPATAELIPSILDALSKVAHHEANTTADKSYIEQLLMSAVESAAVQDIPNLKASSIRLDIIVELIRTAENPQIFNQALLLMGSMTRIAPDAVLHNVMPVFTFMGSNIFHRDDAYSFRVVQKTIDNIVPVMVSSLRRVHTNKEELFVASRDFLRIFCDATSHIPRHRRTNFFTHLVDVLGPNDFLAPVCMLLVDRNANRVIRQKRDDLQHTLSLPLSVLHHCSTPMQISALTDILKEGLHLVAQVIDPSGSVVTFLETPRDDGHALTSVVTTKRRAQSLIMFVEHTLRASKSTFAMQHGEGAVGEFFKYLLLLSTAAVRAPEADLRDIDRAAHSALNAALSVVSASDFARAALSMLESNDRNLQIGALDILSDRLGHVKEKNRHDISSDVVRTIGHIKKILARDDTDLVVKAFRALKAISSSSCEGEESVLSSLVPDVLVAVQKQTMKVHAMPLLPTLCVKLGPRIIPHFRAIVQECTATLQQALQGNNSDILSDSLNVILGLLQSIPTFWGQEEVRQVLRVYLDCSASKSGSHRDAMVGVMKAIAKRVPVRSLIPTVCGLCPLPERENVDTSYFVGYFELVRRTLRATPRNAVLEYLRPLFKVFVDALDVRSYDSSLRITEVEDAIIASFNELVVKLNETAFRPLFRKLYDWAFTESKDARKTTFCRVYGSLLDYFKGLMTPYMSFLVSPFVELLEFFSDSSNDDVDLWNSLLATVTKSLRFDEGAFWREDRLRQIAPALVQQIAVCIRLPAGSRDTLIECMNSLVDATHDDALLKKINLDVLMHTRSEDARLRLFAITCAESIWNAHSAKLLGFVSETTTFIAECAEDENDSVVREIRKLKDAVEMVAGEIDGL